HEKVFKPLLSQPTKASATTTTTNAAPTPVAAQ
ncbi:hypothetical protein JCM6882_005761, partial [Rhodosporidiobolus microsporus]